MTKRLSTTSANRSPGPQQSGEFVDRHIGTAPRDQTRMLTAIGHASIEDLLDAPIPRGVRSTAALDLPDAVSEVDVLGELRELAALNTPGEAMIGLGYCPTITPPVIRRNPLESPAWYTAYTPYQPAISQGRLEELLNFQTMVADLAALPVANASLLDEGTAAEPVNLNEARFVGIY